ncbi:5245_t:CDS:2, partial [Dentiscutata heterogama]
MTSDLDVLQEHTLFEFDFGEVDCEDDDTTVVQVREFLNSLRALSMACFGNCDSCNNASSSASGGNLGDDPGGDLGSASGNTS